MQDRRPRALPAAVFFTAIPPLRYAGRRILHGRRNIALSNARSGLPAWNSRARSDFSARLAVLNDLPCAPLGSQKVPGVPMKGRLMDSIGFDVPNLKAYVDRIAANGVKFDVPYGRDPELGLMSATLTDPWGATIQLTEGLNNIAGVAPYSYIDGYVVVRPLD